MKLIFFANTDWYLYNFCVSTAVRLRKDGHEVVMLSPPGPFGDRFAAHGFRWIQLSMDRASLNPLREAATLSRLVAILRKEQPDLLHNYTMKCVVYGALTARIARVPAVVNAVAGMGYVFTSDALKARMLRPLVKTLMRMTLNDHRSLLILQNPDDVMAFTDADLILPDRIRLIRGTGVDTMVFQPAVPPLHRDGRLRVLLAARLLWEKGIQEFADAAALLRQWGHDVECLLAGSPDPGNPHSVPQEQVRQWVDQGLIRWLGHVDDMPGLLNTVHVMVLPSYYREGVPKSLLEGAASGLALITTDRPGCREVVSKDGVDGLHAEAQSALSLAKCIARLDGDRGLLEQLSVRARQKVLREFDERAVIQKTIDVYGELTAPYADASASRSTS
ncbi:glycosyltransferase family 4 protein [Dyella nitratireducens]|uniref:Glycosyl transferase family 1 n=1 Tax=Dyella nitratireducens TaxID=1849580 RepID=A0ABQ1GFY2_9GAMM|nr:glycosyltransferase family 4 protein [Dyella nitratireducens]GGA42764.1 glycosyl transferase family 1 [Dyella nitratireducens]GLQ41960.1 glycosyl transferase family 1 [Dyella nitratireducens]